MVIFYALMSALTYGAADFLGGFSTKKNPASLVVAFSQCAGLVTALAAFPFLGGTQVTLPDILWGIAAGISGAAGVGFLYQGLSQGLASVISPAAALSGAVIPVFFGLILGERPPLLAWAGVAAALPAILLLSTEKHPEKRDFVFRSLRTGLLAGLAFSGFFIMISRTRPESGFWPLVAARSTTIPLFFLFTFLRKHSLRPAKRTLPFILASGLLDMLANIGFLLAARTGYMILAVVLTALYPAPTVLFQRIFLKEPLTWSRLAGLVLAVTGAALIGAGR